MFLNFPDSIHLSNTAMMRYTLAKAETSRHSRTEIWLPNTHTLLTHEHLCWFLLLALCPFTRWHANFIWVEGKDSSSMQNLTYLTQDELLKGNLCQPRQILRNEKNLMVTEPRNTFIFLGTERCFYLKCSSFRRRSPVNENTQEKRPKVIS